MHPLTSRWSAAAALLLVLAASGFASTGCAAESTEGDVGSADDALTVENGDKYIISVDSSVVTLAKSVAGVPFRFAAADFANKNVLIHPLEKKTVDGLYAHVEKVEDLDNTLVLHTRPLQFEEMETTSGADVIRLYRNRQLPVAPTSPQPAGLEGFGDLLGPSAFAAPLKVSGIAPLTFGGPLAGDFSPDVWVGNKHAYGGGQITTSVESAQISFKPSAILDYTRGKGLSIGVRGQFTADVALKAKGYAEGHVVFFESPTLKSPRLTFIVPIGVPPLLVPVPIVMGVDTYVECTTLGAVEFDGVFKAHMSVNASASAIIRPSFHTPVNQWVDKGIWPNTVNAQMNFSETAGSKVSGSAGVACAAPRIEFPITVAGLIGPFIAIHPEFAATTSGFKTTIDLYAGAASEIGNERFFELLLLRWEPGQGKE